MNEQDQAIIADLQARVEKIEAIIAEFVGGDQKIEPTMAAMALAESIDAAFGQFLHTGKTIIDRVPTEHEKPCWIAIANEHPPTVKGGSRSTQIEEAIVTISICYQMAWSMASHIRKHLEEQAKEDIAWTGGRIVNLKLINHQVEESAQFAQIVYATITTREPKKD